MCPQRPISKTNWSPAATGVTIKFSSSYNLTAYREHSLSDTAFVALFLMTLAPLTMAPPTAALGHVWEPGAQRLSC